MKTAPSTHHLLARSCYAACALVVFLYVNLFSLYRLLEDRFGSGFITWAPVLLPAVLLLLFFIKIARKDRKNGKTLKHSWIWPGIFLCIFALFLPDPGIAVKKIHVTEYLLLSLLARYAMSSTYSGLKLFCFSVLFAALLGVHDEFLQGLHPFRTYGLRDMAVNICSAIGGGCVWHGLHLFSEHAGRPAGQTARQSPVVVYYLICLIAGVSALAVPVSGYLQSRIPVWTILPLAASLVFWVLYYPAIQKTQDHHGISVLSYTSMLFLLYPVIGYVFQVTFY